MIASTIEPIANTAKPPSEANVTVSDLDAAAARAITGRASVIVEQIETISERISAVKIFFTPYDDIIAYIVYQKCSKKAGIMLFAAFLFDYTKSQSVICTICTTLVFSVW